MPIRQQYFVAWCQFGNAVNHAVFAVLLGGHTRRWRLRPVAIWVDLQLKILLNCARHVCAEWAERENAAAAKHSVIILAARVPSGDTLGIVSGLVRKSRREVRLEIAQLYVAPASRGTGLGQVLVASIQSAAIDLSATLK